MRFSPSTQSFYPEDIEYPNIPADVVTVTQAEFDAAIQRGPYDTLSVVNGALVITAGTAPTLTSAQAAHQQIVALEATITPRHMREAALGTDGGWLKTIDAQITQLRNVQ